MSLDCRIAVVGAGPVGLALALYAAQLLPRAKVTLFDARALDKVISGDPRTLALSLGSVQLLKRLRCWNDAAAQSIQEVHVSQQPPSLGEAEVRMRASDAGVTQLGAVLAYGSLVAPMQQAWKVAAAAEPQRLHSRFGSAVVGLKTLSGGVEVDAGVVDDFDLAVVAEGGVFVDRTQGHSSLPALRKGLSHDYRQTAWVGSVTLHGAPPGTAFERFTRQGPAALLPLQPAPDGTQRAALVWCVPSNDDPVRDLSDAQRLAVLQTILPPAAGRLVGISSLKAFALGLQAEMTLVQGRTVRIGNAAQTLHPVAGQGLNLGLRDVHELVSKLRWSTDIDSALRGAEWARAPDRWAMIAATDFLARSFTWKLPGAATARGLGLLALDAMPGAKAWLARRMMF
ncbi:MAG TPA: FAD-dependent monooxygenase, partial [Rubrivivax sp.]|nr:FAD-dependent monooxygenase [Rubrivivax sp.]